MAFKLRNLLPKRRWARWSVGVLLFLALVWLVAPRLAAPYVRAKLQKMVASGVAAELRMEGLTYLPPFGVRVRDARLVGRDAASGTEIDLLKIARLDLRLAKLPFGDGPLVIQRIDVADPQLHLILTEKGIAAAEALAPGPQPAGPSPQAAGAKLSDMFELRHFSLSGGRVVVEDRTRPGSVPMVWAGLSATSEMTQSSRSAYTFQFKGDHKGVAAFNADGSFDLDDPRVTLRAFDLAVAADPSQQTSGLPAQIQTVLRANNVAGNIGLRGAADLPLRDLASATFDVTAEVNDASARPAGGNVPLDSLGLSLHARTLEPPAGGVRPIEVRLTRFTAASRDARLTFAAEPPATLAIDRAANRWALRGLSLSADMGAAEHALRLAGRLSVIADGSGPLKPPAGQTMSQAADYHAVARPSGVRVLPPGFPLPLEKVGGPGAEVELRPGVVVLKDISATYGGDALLLRGARIPLPDDLGRLKQSFAVEEIDGQIDFRQQPNPPYPRKFGKVVETLRPAGPFEIGGGSYYRVSRIEPSAGAPPPVKKRKSDWYFGVSTDTGSLTLSDRNIRIAQITGDATVSNLLIDITRLNGSVFGGAISASAKILPGKPFPLTDGRIVLRDVDLAEVAKTLQPESPNEKLVGRGFLTATNLAGAFADDKESGTRASETFRGKGEFEVIKGHLWTLPVLGEVASRTKPKNGLTLGEAAGVFHLDEGGVVLDNAAVSSPALALMGTGRIGFDKSIDLEIVAAPLGDLRDHIRRTRIPILSDVAGEVVGGVQRLINAATSTLLYQFRVTGTLEEPRVATVPAPVLTDPTALLLGRLLEPKTDQRLLDVVRPKPAK